MWAEDRNEAVNSNFDFASQQNTHGLSCKESNLEELASYSGFSQSLSVLSFYVSIVIVSFNLKHIHEFPDKKIVQPYSRLALQI